MKLCDLVKVNWNWKLCEKLDVYLQKEGKKIFVSLRSAVKLYGDREVTCFHDNVVYLL